MVWICQKFLTILFMNMILRVDNCWLCLETYQPALMLISWDDEQNEVRYRSCPVLSRASLFRGNEDRGYWSPFVVNTEIMVLAQPRCILGMKPQEVVEADDDWQGITVSGADKLLPQQCLCCTPNSRVLNVTRLGKLKEEYRYFQ